MGKHTHLKYTSRTEVSFTCDVCGEPITRWKRGEREPPKCEICEKYLCRDCKRHVHVEIGGKKLPAGDVISVTMNYCPADYERIRPCVDALLVRCSSSLLSGIRVEDLPPNDDQ